MIKKRITWTKEMCKNEAFKFNTREKYKIGSKSYETARRNGWLNEICSHMVSGRIKKIV